VIWSGVPVRLVAEALGGVSQGARFVTGTGGEELPEGVDPKEVIVERSIPLEKGMQDALLAWEMNGQPIPLVHGGPLRLIVPGYFGVNNVKFVKRLAFTPDETDAHIMRSGYRIRPVGESGAPDQPTMWEMPVKSWINHPSGEGSVRAGRVLIDGVAFSGTGGVRSVEVSTDGGATWQDAPLVGPDLGPYAWRQFAVAVELPAGTHTLASRATDVNGEVQAEERVENERGYGDTSWRDHAVTVTVA
jgi:DMSO/TMAO reductase YedYZ molybdopterin-dependent catalytic subunit